MNPMERVGRFTRGSEDFALPAVTGPQQIAVGQAFVAVLATLGFDLGGDSERMLLVVSGILAVVLPLSDAVIRTGRAKHAPQLAKAAEMTRRSAPAAADPERARVDEADAELTLRREGR